MATEIYAGRQMLYHAAHLRDSGKVVSREAAMVKLFCTEMACRVADNAVQIHGGMGYMNETFVSRYYRDSRLLSIGGGTDEVMREILSKLEGF